MIKEYVLGKVLDAAINNIKKILNESNIKSPISVTDVEQSIHHHLRSVNNWSKEISFKGIKQAKQTFDIFIELDLLVVPRNLRYEDEKEETIPLKQIFDYTKHHFILLGQPGSGKTTSMKYLCQNLFLDSHFQHGSLAFPLVIKLRELNGVSFSKDSSLIINSILGILGLKINLSKKKLSDELGESEAIAIIKKIKEKIVVSALENLSVLLILDGFDELNEGRNEVLQEIRLLASQLERSRMIVTSRTGDFVYNIDNATLFEICSLGRAQVSAFAVNWLKNEDDANQFLERVFKSPFADTTIRPLALSHLCSLYERLGKIPDKPKKMYKKIIDLLLEDWDAQRSVKRFSSYANFEVDEKLEFLSSLAYGLTIEIKKQRFTNSDLLRVYRQIYKNYSLNEREALPVVREVETHTGLFLQSGYEHFEFAHKSFQEYLTGRYLVNTPIPNINELIYLPNEIAIATALSTNSSLYLSELVFNRLLNANISSSFFQPFIIRLALEQPDFNPTSKSGWAAVLLLSLYVETYIENEQFRMFEIKDSIEKMIRSALSGNPLYLSYYEKREATSSISNIFRMTRKDLKGIDYVQKDILPEQIYIPNWLISNL